MTNQFEILTVYKVDEVGAEGWDQLSAGRPFQSAAWYRFGERVMADCSPIYIILMLDKQPVARGTFWLVRNEPLPVAPILRRVLAALLQRWPLLICRSPLSNSSGLILPEGRLGALALQKIADAARLEARRRRCSFLLFDYLNEAETRSGWPPEYRLVTLSDPGTLMNQKWASFEEYLQAQGKKDRQHYKHSRRAAEQAGIRVERCERVAEVEQALRLIRAVEKEHHSPANPWIRGLLEALPMTGGTFMRASIADRLVGCGVLVYDGETQLALALGHAREIPFVYFQLLYAGLQEAFEKRVRRLRWGSGAYDVKRRLGFEIEHNNQLVVCGSNPFFRGIASLVKV